MSMVVPSQIQPASYNVGDASQGRIFFAKEQNNLDAGQWLELL